MDVVRTCMCALAPELCVLCSVSTTSTSPRLGLHLADHRNDFCSAIPKHGHSLSRQRQETMAGKTTRARTAPAHGTALQPASVARTRNRATPLGMSACLDVLMRVLLETERWRTRSTLFCYFIILLAGGGSVEIPQTHGGTLETGRRATHSAVFIPYATDSVWGWTDRCSIRHGGDSLALPSLTGFTLAAALYFPSGCSFGVRVPACFPTCFPSRASSRMQCAVVCVCCRSCSC
ncbi:hypothetical protein EDD21DRAFT_393171 [Dissophora ornata]|nr:hypothetical protein EDD21DRAFT_393171 [Dissophora ornata]